MAVVGTYLVCVRVGNSVPGAPSLQLSLLVVAPTGRVVGHGEIDQAIAPPDGRIPVSNLHGRIHHLGFGPAVRVLTLQGSYSPPLEPIEIPFTVTLVIGEDDWKGRGTFSYGGHEIEDVPVVPEPCAPQE